MRFYTQNVCCLPVGARELYLQKAGFCAVLIAVVLVVWVAMSVADDPVWWWLNMGVVAMGLWFGAFHVAAIYIGFGLVGVWQRSRGHHDYKTERLAKLAARLAQEEYDVVMLQELFGTWYGDRHRQQFTAAMQKGGYKYVAMPSAIAHRPSCWANSGLAIFSRHPLQDINHQPFRSQTAFDKFSVNRAVMGVTVMRAVEQGGPIRAYTTHFAPPLSVLEEVQQNVPAWIPDLIDVYPQQLAELQETLLNTNPHNFPVYIAGDFNAQIHSHIYLMLCKGLASVVGLDHLTAQLLEPHGAPTTANPSGEVLLTGASRSERTLDFAFATKDIAATVIKCEVLPQKVDDDKDKHTNTVVPYQFLSDHKAIVVTCR